MLRKMHQFISILLMNSVFILITISKRNQLLCYEIHVIIKKYNSNKITRVKIIQSKND